MGHETVGSEGILAENRQKSTMFDEFRCFSSCFPAAKVMVDTKRPSIDKTRIEFDQPQAPKGWVNTSLNPVKAR